MIIIIALYIILGIIAFFALILNLRIRVTIDMEKELELYVTVCGIKIKILPKKPKKYKLSNYTLKKIAKRDRKKAIKEAKKSAAQAIKKKKKAEEKKRKKEVEAKLTKAEKKAAKARKKASMPPLPPLISLLLKTLGYFFPGVFGKFHFHIARIKLSIGGPDAAQTAIMYYAVTNAIGPTLDFIDKHSNLHGRRTAEIDVRPDFLSDEIKADVKLGFSTSIGGVLSKLIGTAFKFLFGFIKIKPSASAQGHSVGGENKPSEKEPKAERSDGKVKTEKAEDACS